MSDARLTAASPGRWRVEGVLDVTTVMPLVRAARDLQAQSAGIPEGRIEIDLSGVESANSAGLALLLEWMEMARARGLTLVYLRLPDSLQRIAAFSNLRSLLPLGD